MMIDPKAAMRTPPAVHSRTLRIAGGHGAEIIIGPYLTREEARAAKEAIEDFVMRTMRRNGAHP